MKIQADVSIIVPTIGRPGDLRRLLSSIISQTVLPKEFILVDASGNNQCDEVVKKILDNSGIIYKYYQTRRGSAYQRNFGSSMAKGGILQFLDDDNELKVDYFEKLLAVYERNPQVVGVMGVIEDWPHNGLLGLYFRKFFQLPHNQGQGRLQRSGYPAWNICPKTDIEVEFMNGTMSIKRDIFVEYKFNERFEGYALMEDVELSYRVSRKYRLLETPQARMHHFDSPIGRGSVKEFNRQQVKHHYAVWRLMSPSFLGLLAYYFSEIGEFLLTFGYLFKYGSFDALKGALQGWQERKSFD